MLRYFASLTTAKTVLWCYLIWYLVIVVRYFDPAPAIWFNAVGISLLIGIALMLGLNRVAAQPVDHWQTFRLFLTPFCVSSFSSLIKNRGFFLIMPPDIAERLIAPGLCMIFVLVVNVLKQRAKKSGTNHGPAASC